MNNAAQITMPSHLINSRENALPNNPGAANAEFEKLETLFRDYHQTVFRAAYRITGSPSDAEDVLQTVFLRLAPHAAHRDLSTNAGGYLHRAAVNASLDLLRNRARVNSVSLETVDFERDLNFSKPSPEKHLANAELRELIRRAVAKLEGRAATVFALRYFEDYDNRQIAEVLGTSQMVVAVTLHRAKARLRKEIGNYLEKNYEA